MITSSALPLSMVHLTLLPGKVSAILKIFFTLPNAVFDHGIDETGFFGGDLSGQFRNIDDC